MTPGFAPSAYVRVAMEIASAKNPAPAPVRSIVHRPAKNPAPAPVRTHIDWAGSRARYRASLRGKLIFGTRYRSRARTRARIRSRSRARSRSRSKGKKGTTADGNPQDGPRQEPEETEKGKGGKGGKGGMEKGKGRRMTTLQELLLERRCNQIAMTSLKAAWQEIKDLQQ